MLVFSVLKSFFKIYCFFFTESGHINVDRVSVSGRSQCPLEINKVQNTFAFNLLSFYCHFIVWSVTMSIRNKHSSKYFCFQSIEQNSGAIQSNICSLFKIKTFVSIIFVISYSKLIISIFHVNLFSIQFPAHLASHVPDQGPVSNKNLFQTAQKSLSNSSES